MDIFKGQNVVEFVRRFKTDVDCKEYLAHWKWGDGFKCVKCGHNASQVRADHSRTCNICSHTESATAGTLFHRVRFGVLEAFHICFEMSTTTKGLSASQVGVRYGITEKTARMFMHKVREAMASSGRYPMDGEVHVDEFVVGGKEDGKVGRSYDSKKKKLSCAVQLTREGKVRRMYAHRIEDFSAKELKRMFTLHIAGDAKVTADEWRGYGPIAREYNVEQIPSNNGKNFKALHTMVHQVKSWIRTTYSWVSEFHINRYLNEFCYRLNRSQSKANIFNNLIKRMVAADKIHPRQLVCS